MAEVRPRARLARGPKKSAREPEGRFRHLRRHRDARVRTPAHRTNPRARHPPSYARAHVRTDPLRVSPFAPLPGYAPKWKAVENAIKAKFPKTETSGEPTPTSSGAFEVDINGTIVHSKLNGDGHVDSPEKMEKILAAIAAAE